MREEEGGEKEQEEGGEEGERRGRGGRRGGGEDGGEEGKRRGRGGKEEGGEEGERRMGFIEIWRNGYVDYIREKVVLTRHLDQLQPENYFEPCKLY